MRDHRVVIKTDSLRKSSSGVSFVAQCCGEYEESFHFEQVGHYTVEELQAKIERCLERAQAAHENKLAGEEHLENLLKQYANGVPSCTECG